MNQNEGRRCCGSVLDTGVIHIAKSPIYSKSSNQAGKAFSLVVCSCVRGEYINKAWIDLWCLSCCLPRRLNALAPHVMSICTSRLPNDVKKYFGYNEDFPQYFKVSVQAVAKSTLKYQTPLHFPLNFTPHLSLTHSLTRFHSVPLTKYRNMPEWNPYSSYQNYSE